MRRGFVFLFIFIISISLVSAVWWNPWTWFEKKEVKLSPIMPWYELGGKNCPFAEGTQTCQGPYNAFYALPTCKDKDGKSIFPSGASIYISWSCHDFNNDPTNLEWGTPWSALYDCDGDDKYILASPISNSLCGTSFAEDCDDTNDTLWKWMDVYDDNDEDGYNPAGAVKHRVCTDGTIPRYHTTKKSLIEDCNDGPDDPSDGCPVASGSTPSCSEEDILRRCASCVFKFVEPLYPDMDKDSWTFGGPMKICTGGSIGYYKNSKSDPEDCNDDPNDVLAPSIHPSPPLETVCDDNRDNDCNQKVDCEDSNCDMKDCSKLFEYIDSITGFTINKCTDSIGTDECVCCDGKCEEKVFKYDDCDGDGNGNALTKQKYCPGITHNPSTFCELATNGDDCDDRPNGRDGIEDTADDGVNIYPGQNMYPIPANKDELCSMCNYSKGNVVFGDFNPESMHNCYRCNPISKSSEFIPNNPPRDGDCFYCDETASGPALDPTSPFSDYSATPPIYRYLHVDDYSLPGITLYKIVPDSSTSVPSTAPRCPKDIGVGVPCIYINNPALSDSLEKIYFYSEPKEDCKTCDWQKGSYQWRKAAGEQAKLINANEDNANADGNCSMCRKDFITGEWGLRTDVGDSRFDTTLPPSSGAILCQRCSLDPGKPDKESFDEDPRVWGLGVKINGYDFDRYEETTCKRCENGKLLPEKNLAISNWCPGCSSSFLPLSSADAEKRENQKCCGGSRYNSVTEGCCPTSITGNSTIDDYTGSTFSLSGGIFAQKCCREVKITANSAPNWRDAFEESVTYMGLPWNFLKYAIYNGPDGKVEYSKTTRKVISGLDNDYCSGSGYGKTEWEMCGYLVPCKRMSTNDICEPCQPSKKMNTLPTVAIQTLGSNLGYTAWLAGMGGTFLLSYDNLDSALGLKGYPRYNRICYDSSVSIPIIGIPTGIGTKSKCGECDPASNSKLKVDTEVKVPFSNAGINLWFTWKRKQNTAECQLEKEGNIDTTKFASASASTKKVNGTYWCNPDGECEVQNEIVPGWIKYWTKKALAALSLFQAVHGTLQLLDRNQGGEIVPSLPCCGGSASSTIKVGGGNTQASSTSTGLGDEVPALGSLVNTIGKASCDSSC